MLIKWSLIFNLFYSHLISGSINWQYYFNPFSPSMAYTRGRIINLFQMYLYPFFQVFFLFFPVLGLFYVS